MSFIINIRRAIPEEHPLLSDISLRSKRIWPYPEEYFTIWREELTITPEYIAGNLVYLAEMDNKIIGYYAIIYNPQDRQVGEVFVEKGCWLEHLFILPEYIHQSIGRGLLNHAINECRKLSCRRLVIFVDPFARGFYEKMGAHFLYDSPSSIRGRKIPVFGITIPEN